MNASVSRGVKQPAAKKAASSKTAGTAASKAAPKNTASKTAATPAARRPQAEAAAPAAAKRARGTTKAATTESAAASGVSSNKASAGSADRIQKPEVSRASEVATKTSKPTPPPTEETLLTEEQILQMGEKDYMNPAQLAFFKDRLQQLERDLLRNAGETTEHLRETVLVPDPADRATIEEEHALELRTRDRERKLLKKVQQSLAAIETGDYGWCEETGEPIGIPRLLARPTATLSLEAQQRRELKQKLYGD